MEAFILIFGLIFLGIILGLCINVFWLGFALIFYFAPAVVAMYRKHPHGLWIFLLNLFFGWSVIGWLIALLWALDFDKIMIDFIEYRKAKTAKDVTIEGEVVSDSNENKDGKNKA